jgi:hypothetical protein
MSKKLDVQGILTEARSDIECIVMAAPESCRLMREAQLQPRPMQ